MEVAGDVISGENVRTMEGYVGLNFEVSEFSTVRDILNKKPTNWWGGKTLQH